MIKSSRIKPDFAEALNNKGIGFYNLGKYNEAIEYFDKALRIKPDDAEALNNKKVAQEQLGKKGKDNKGFSPGLETKVKER